MKVISQNDFHVDKNLDEIDCWIFVNSNGTLFESRYFASSSGIRKIKNLRETLQVTKTGGSGTGRNKKSEGASEVVGGASKSLEPQGGGGVLQTPSNVTTMKTPLDITRRVQL